MSTSNISFFNTKIGVYFIIYYWQFLRTRSYGSNLGPAPIHAHATKSMLFSYATYLIPPIIIRHVYHVGALGRSTSAHVSSWPPSAARNSRLLTDTGHSL
ncbi:hypothetical protein O6H91_16G094300 [Diphasiastrum complanatum]|uniref:Uncharacterized protein n=1 Tax=Diphasiastrum complanatum TaxID=34168 RepID=A0ACC2BF24_DIPCM|nr:hypothetical protein O6H91_16G094300 [Diphasiastrum complanatum]